MILFRLIFILALLSNIGLYIYSRQNVPKQIQFTATDPGIQKLVLISEMDAENTLWEETSDTTESEIVDEPFNQECYSVGAFNARSEIRPILDVLKTEVIKIRTRKIISSQEVGYWVYIPAFKTREEALSLGRQLSQNDIKDYYVVTGGENENKVSLGHYRESQNADDRLAELLSKGFNAEKQLKVEQWPEFWLDYAIASDQSENLVDVSTINPDISTNLVECNW